MQPKDNQFVKLRKQKLTKLRDLGIDPYPIKSERSHLISEVLEGREEWIASEREVTLAGRLVAMRRQGKLGLATLRTPVERSRFTWPKTLWEKRTTSFSSSVTPAISFR